MPFVQAAGPRPHRSHRFPGVDAAMLRSSIDGRAVARRTRTSVEVDIELTATGAAGHAVPTGDILRRLVVAVRPPGARRFADAVTLSRLFRPILARRNDATWTVSVRDVSDTRIPVTGARRVALRPRGVRARVNDIEWTVAHERMPPEMARRRRVPDGRNRTTIIEELVPISRSLAAHQLTSLE